MRRQQCRAAGAGAKHARLRLADAMRDRKLKKKGGGSSRAVQWQTAVVFAVVHLGHIQIFYDAVTALNCV